MSPAPIPSAPSDQSVSCLGGTDDELEQGGWGGGSVCTCVPTSVSARRKYVHQKEQGDLCSLPPCPISYAAPLGSTDDETGQGEGVWRQPVCACLTIGVVLKVHVPLDFQVVKGVSCPPPALSHHLCH